MNRISTSELHTIITDPDGAELLVSSAANIANYLKSRKLSTNQLRALFGEVRQIESEWGMGGARRQKAFRRLILLKPKMEYRAKKEDKLPVRDLVEVLNPAVDMIIKEKDEEKQDLYFRHFVEFFEAILAYFGGK